MDFLSSLCPKMHLNALELFMRMHAASLRRTKRFGKEQLILKGTTEQRECFFFFYYSFSYLECKFVNVMLNEEFGIRGNIALCILLVGSVAKKVKNMQTLVFQGDV